MTPYTWGLCAGSPRVCLLGEGGRRWGLVLGVGLCLETYLRNEKWAPKEGRMHVALAVWCPVVFPGGQRVSAVEDSVRLLFLPVFGPCLPQLCICSLLLFISCSEPRRQALGEERPGIPLLTMWVESAQQQEGELPQGVPSKPPLPAHLDQQ